MVRQKEDSKRVKVLKRNARRHSIKEGIFATAKSSFGDYYLSPFAIAINSSSSLVAMLGSVAGLLGPISQVFGSRLIEKHTRKKIILRAVFWESLMWLPLIAIAVLFSLGIIANMLPLLFLLSFSFYVIFAHVSAPAWFSWVGDIIDEKRRGRWFSKRNFILGFVSVVLALGASFFLDYFREMNLTMIGFIILFSLALVFRFLSWRVFKKQYEPELKLRKGDYFSFGSFLRNSRNNNFGRFTIFRAFLALAQSIAAPLFVVYLLRNLSFSYPTYMVITMAGTVFSLLVLPIWGKFADKYGNYLVLFITTILIPLIPILWVFSASPIYLLFIPTLISGISWAGFNLSASNFIYDNVSANKRGLAVSYHNMLHGVGIFFGAGIGALLIGYLTVSFIEPILLIFLISGIARMIVIFIFIPTIKEVRKTSKFDGKRTLKNMVLKQIRPALMEELHEIRSIKKYLRGK